MFLYFMCAIYPHFHEFHSFHFAFFHVSTKSSGWISRDLGWKERPIIQNVEIGSGGVDLMDVVREWGNEFAAAFGARL